MKWTPELLAQAERNAQEDAEAYARWEAQWQRRSIERRPAELAERLRKHR